MFENGAAEELDDNKTAFFDTLTHAVFSGVLLAVLGSAGWMSPQVGWGVAVITYGSVTCIELIDTFTRIQIGRNPNGPTFLGYLFGSVPFYLGTIIGFGLPF